MQRRFWQRYYLHLPLFRHFYYPDTKAKDAEFPLVIFSHGAFGYYESNSSTYLELASKGYVVISLDHPYHSFYTEDTDGKLIIVDPGFMQEVQYVNENNTPETDIFDYSSKWLKLRTDDMSFVIDTIQLAKKKDIHTSEDVMNAIKMADDNNIGLFGHSLDGATGEYCHSHPGMCFSTGTEIWIRGLFCSGALWTA